MTKLNETDTALLSIKSGVIASLGDAAIFTVEKIDGSSVKIDLHKVPFGFFVGFLIDGIAEYHRDSSSGALASAFNIAFPDHELEGDALKEARKAWKADGNADKVAAESSAMMADTNARLNKGERRVVRVSAGPAFTPLQDAAYDAAVSMKGLAACKPIADAYKAAKGESTAARMLRVLAAVESLPKPLVDAINDNAKKTVKAAADMMAAMDKANISLES